ncbi:MAG: hypothetical protein JNK32_12760 [Anaerolineales bacterium]|nr:hypothetical protein [Anaerolineales bacterium]
MNQSDSETEAFYLYKLLSIFNILGVVVGLVVGIGLSNLAARGKLSFWVPIVSTTIISEKILYADSNTVWVATDLGEVYFHRLNCSPLATGCITWKSEENPGWLNGHVAIPLDNEGCNAKVFVRPNAPPRNSIQCVYASRVHTLNDGFTYYAVDSDHKVWYWRTPNRWQGLFLVFTFILVGLFAGSLFGKKLTARRKGRLKEVSNDLVSLFASMLLFAIGGGVLGVIAGNIILKFESKGAFTSWQLLESSVKFAEIVDADTNTVWAQSEDEKLYYRKLSCVWETCDTWEEVDTVSDEADTRNEVVVFGNTCSFAEGNAAQGNIKPQKQPDNVVECVLAYGAMYESAWTAYYALLDDGTIWSWKYTSDMFKFIFIPLYSVLVGLLSGAIMGIVVFIVRKARLKKNSLTT